MSTIHINKCPVCGNTTFDSYLHAGDWFASNETFDIDRCSACGFLFTQDFPPEERIGAYYESADYVSHSDSHLGVVNKLYHTVRSFMLKSKARLIEKQSGKKAAKGTLLDIGAGTGYFVNEMKQRGWQVSAIEKNPTAREFIKKHWHIEAQGGEALFTLGEKQWDVITLWHVLEHLQHLSETMQKLHNMLNDDGTLVVALPNSASYDAHHYKEYWAAYDVPRHLWHFSPDTFARLAERYGFTIIRTKHMPFDVFYVSLLSEKYRGKSFRMVRALWRASIGWLLSLFAKEQTSSLIYILKKVSKVG